MAEFFSLKTLVQFTGLVKKTTAKLLEVATPDPQLDPQ